MEKACEISVIIYSYDLKTNISKTFDSLFCQTFKNFEIIVINENPSNCIENVISEYKKKHNNIKYFSTNNSKSILINKILKNVKGKYIFPMGISDTIEPRTFEICMQKMKKNNYNFLFMEWKIIDKKTKNIKYNFHNKEISIHDVFYNDDCYQFLNKLPYRITNKLYDYDFFMNNIKRLSTKQMNLFNEEIYYINFCLEAKSIGVIHSPLYTYQTDVRRIIKNKINKENCINDFSVTNFEIIKLNIKSSLAQSYVINTCYSMLKSYYNQINSKHLKLKLVEDFIKTFSQIDLTNFENINKPVRKVFGGKMNTDELIEDLDKTKPVKYKKNIRKIVRKYKKNIYKMICTLLPINKNFILLIGYQYKFTGNLKYLYYQMKEKYPKHKYMYVVKEYDSSLPKRYQLIHKSFKYYYYFLKSKIIVYETYFYTSLPKRKNQFWILIWHGTTVKKLLFDYNTKYTILKNSKHKIKKFRFTSNLDYLITDNANINKYFETSFLLNHNQILAYGYPRVKYLVDNVNNQELKKEIRKKVGINNSKKTILYVPTWRDYNYIKKDTDFNYLLNLEKLQKLTASKYNIIFKNHPHLNNFRFNNKEIIEDVSCDTQDLLQIADYVISDYSSIVFDAMAINLPIIIYANDIKKYEESHGVYIDVFDDLLNWEAKNEEDVFNLIKSYEINEKYEEIKKKYCLDMHNYKTLDFTHELLNKKNK